MRARGGLTLIEVLAALAILGVCTVSTVGMLVQSAHSVRSARIREGQVQGAAALLARMSVWTETDFLSRARGPDQRVTITPRNASLYDVSIADSAGAVLLTTSFYVRHAADTTR
jgi:prepilin-type N-terminal cleavage/methylation domain-containing protein